MTPPIVKPSETTDPLASLLATALERRIEEETSLYVSEVDTLRALLDQFATHVRAEVRHRTLSTMLASVGEKAPPFTPPAPDVEAKLKTSLRALLGQLGEPDPFVQAPRPSEVVEEAAPQILTPEEPVVETPSLDNLRRAIANRPVALVGGITVNEKVTLLHKRFDLPVEWLEIDSGAPRSTENALRRIRKRSVGAVIILESFLPHKAANPLVEACNLARIPWAYGARAGVGTIATALQELDRKTRPHEGSFYQSLPLRAFRLPDFSGKRSTSMRSSRSLVLRGSSKLIVIPPSGWRSQASRCRTTWRTSYSTRLSSWISFE